MQCPNCGHWNEDGSNYCEECGQKLSGTDGQSKPLAIKIASSPITDENAVPNPSPQELEEAEPVAKTFTGAKLVMNNGNSIFRLGEKTLIGRQDARLDIDFEGYPEGQYISSQHAQIIKMNGRFYCEDLGSSNFTFVNDKKLVHGQLEALATGDKLRFGKIVLTFYES